MLGGHYGIVSSKFLQGIYRFKMLIRRNGLVGEIKIKNCYQSSWAS